MHMVMAAERAALQMEMLEQRRAAAAAAALAETIHLGIRQTVLQGQSGVLTDPAAAAAAQAAPLTRVARRQEAMAAITAEVAGAPAHLEEVLQGAVVRAAKALSLLPTQEQHPSGRPLFSRSVWI